VVTGSAGASGKPKAAYPHNAMYYSNYSVGGASMLEVQDNRLELKWISAEGQIGDHFVMMKDVNKNTNITIKKGERATLVASYNGSYMWDKSTETGKTITVSPTKNSTYQVKDAFGCIQDTFKVTVTK
jgi:uncharacterized glyoxalase superfamily protein PhnB